MYMVDLVNCAPAPFKRNLVDIKMCVCDKTHFTLVAFIQPSVKIYCLTIVARGG